MSTLTLRIDDEKHARLRRLSELQGVSMNRLMDELATIADWRSSGDYDRIVTRLVADDPDLAAQ